MTLDERTYARLPAHLKALFIKLPNPGSEEVLAAFPDAPGQLADASSSSSGRKLQNIYGAMKRGNGRDGEVSAENDNGGIVGFAMRPGARRFDGGSAARFFYCAKASREDRNEGLGDFPEVASRDYRMGNVHPGHGGRVPDRAQRNVHPTVKPTDLMRYLVRLVTPPGGVVLDPFLGSGSTGKAAILEGFDFIGIERDADYFEIAKVRSARAVEDRRIATAQAGFAFPDTEATA